MGGRGDDSGPRRHHSRVLVVIGTRPEAIKMFPVVHALAKSEIIRPFVVLTGQHPDLVQPILDVAGITADAELGVASGDRGLNGLVTAAITRFDQLLTELRGHPERRARPRLFNSAGNSDDPYPAATLVHGDTTSAMAAAMAAAGVRLPVVHVESGLRTGDLLSPFPEELNRQIIGRIARLHLAPTISNMANLMHEGVDARRILVTGNTGLDALRYAAGLHAPWPDPRMERIDDDDDSPVVVVTAHRRENWGRGIRGIAEGVAAIARTRPDATIVLPLHPNPTVRDQVEPVLAELPNVILTEPMSYAPFARLLARATLAISDSGGIQEEAPAVGTPVLVARSTSERPEGIEAGNLLLVGTNPNRISTTALRLLSDPHALAGMRTAQTPFGDGHAAARIAAALEHLVAGTQAPHHFGAGFSRREVLHSAGYSDSDLAAMSAHETAPDASHEPVSPIPVTRVPSARRKPWNRAVS